MSASTVSLKVKINQPRSMSRSKETNAGSILSAVKNATSKELVPSSLGIILFPFISDTNPEVKVTYVLAAEVARPRRRLISLRSSSPRNRRTSLLFSNKTVVPSSPTVRLLANPVEPISNALCIFSIVTSTEEALIASENVNEIVSLVKFKSNRSSSGSLKSAVNMPTMVALSAGISTT